MYEREGCPYCGSWWHSGVCPRVSSIEYHENGTIARVTFHRPDQLLPLTVEPEHE